MTTTSGSMAENESLIKVDEEKQEHEDNIRVRQTKPENKTHKTQEHEDIKIDKKTQPQNKKTQRQEDEQPQEYIDYKTVYQTELQNNVSKTQEHKAIKSDHRKCQNKTHRAPDHDNIIKVDETEAKHNERQEHEPQQHEEDTKKAEEAAGTESTTHERQRGPPPHGYNTYKESNVDLLLEDTGRHIITRRQTDDNNNNHEALQMEEVDEDSPYCIYQETILQCDYKDSNKGVTLVRQPRVNGSLSMVTLQHVHHLTLHPTGCYNLYLVAVGQAMVEEQVEVVEEVEQGVEQKREEEIESKEDEEKEVMVVPVVGQEEEGFKDEGNEEMGKKDMIKEEKVEDDEGNEKNQKEDLENQENKVQEKKKPKNKKKMVEKNEDKFINKVEDNNELLTPPTCSCCPLLNLEDVTLDQTPRHVRDLHASTSNISRIHLKGIQNLFTLTETQVGSLRIQEQVQGHVRLRLYDVSLGSLEKLHLSTSSSVNCVKCVIENLPQGALRLSSRGNEFRDTSFGEHTGVIHLVGGAAGVVLENIQGRVLVQTSSCSTLQKLPRQRQQRRPCPREISPQQPPSPATTHNNCTGPLGHSSSPSSSVTPSRDTGEEVCSRDVGLLVVVSLLAVSIVINVCQLLFNQPRKFLVSRLPWHLRGVGRRESLERELFLKGPQRHTWEQDPDLPSLEASVGFYSDNPDADSYSISTNHDDEGETVFYEVELKSPHGAQRNPQIIETPPTPTQRRKYSNIAAKNDTADPLERQMTSLVGHVTETSPSSSYTPQSLREQRRQTRGQQVRKRHHTVNDPLTVQRETNPQQKNHHQTSATLSAGHGKQDKSKEKEIEEDLLGMNNVAPRKNNNNTCNHFSTPTRRRFQSYDGPYL
ncbi:hypothetical protein Pcinc_026884 [Petrolisthes cinctipes]|uniref:Uncharacterized protein n=1 Tax=Petrolisthes cinctipes TaxID=88211 RepID=A0AAE1K7I6_PETCI|nr:hypothetical protein Pcinc_026884 [Petrolisthes cinctipes]